MSAKKLANIQNQPGISTFVGKNVTTVEKEREKKLTTGTTRGTNKSTSEQSIKAKKHIKPGVKAASTSEKGPKKWAQPDNNSPDNNNIQPCKKQSTSMSSQQQNINNNNNSECDGISLKPELQELKRQLFAGFEQLIEPLKKDIQDLKAERQLEKIWLSNCCRLLQQIPDHEEDS